MTLQGTPAPPWRLVYAKNVSLRLKDPPIVEVVCGFHFPSVPTIDPVLVGKYWAHRKEAEGYTRHQVLPAVTSGFGVVFGDGVGPLRSMLIKDTDDFLLQIQADRLYFNWRRRAGSYPHFSDTDGVAGVRKHALHELKAFRDFCEGLPGGLALPAVQRLELAKIDLLEEGRHWTGADELARLIPLLGKLPPVTEQPTLALSLAGKRDGFDVDFSITNAVVTATLSPALKIETRVTGLADGDDAESLGRMNRVANDIFFGILDKDMLDHFGGLLG
jgi:uncharacterized protein (TIGR04255 family)